MDTFMDKLAQKRNAQEIIRANSAAETARLEQMQAQLEAYDGLLQEIRKVNLKTAENAARAQEVLQACKDELEKLQTTGGTSDGGQLAEEMKQLLQEQFQQSNDFLHKENVRVYRNVQAALIEELHKQTQELQAVQTQNKTSKALLPIGILILVGVVADIVVSLLPAIAGWF